MVIQDVLKYIYVNSNFRATFLLAGASSTSTSLFRFLLFWGNSLGSKGLGLSSAVGLGNFA